MARGLRIGVTILLLLGIAVLSEVLFFQGTSVYKRFFVAPCSEPLAYRIGTIDARFHTDTAAVRASLESAAGVWNSAAGKEVLVYAPLDERAVTVNFVYDERQESVAVSEQIDSQKSSLDIQRSTITELEARYDALESAYTAAQAAFEKKFEAYQADVQRANASGGASSQEYRRLTNVSASLKVEEEKLNKQVSELNSLANSIKSRVGVFNQSVRAVNSAVNSFNAATDQDFDAGKYVRTATSTRISIYYFDSEAQLTLEATHEFGHALGLGHNDNPDSVMYPYAKTQKSVLSLEDIAALKVACKLK